MRFQPLASAYYKALYRCRAWHRRERQLGMWNFRRGFHGVKWRFHVIWSGISWGLKLGYCLFGILESVWEKHARLLFFLLFFIFQIYIFSQNHALVLEKHVRHHIKLATWCNHCELVQTSVNNSGRPWILPQSDMLFFPEHRVLSSFSSLKTCIVVHLTTHIPNLWWLNQRNACKKMLDLVRVVDQHLEYDFWKESTLKYIF